MHKDGSLILLKLASQRLYSSMPACCQPCSVELVPGKDALSKHTVQDDTQLAAYLTFFLR